MKEKQKKSEIELPSLTGKEKVKIQSNPDLNEFIVDLPRQSFVQLGFNLSSLDLMVPVGDLKDNKFKGIVHFINPAIQRMRIRISWQNYDSDLPKL
jgi:hypothetical protein